MRRRLKPRGESMTRRIGTLNLRAYPTAPGPEVPQAVMVNDLFSATLNARTETRRRFGRSISMDVIETALRLAHRGSMRNLTDILRETVETDPHLGSILNKRFGSVANLPWEVQPATGAGVDREKAMFYAEVVRQQIRNMKTFRRNLAQLAWALFDGRACLELQWVELGAGSAMSSDQFGSPVIGIREMDWIHPRRLSFGPERELRIQPEDGPTTGNFAPVGLDVRALPDKFVYWLPQIFGDYPEREGLGIRCMYWSFFKRFAARERMILSELFGKPWRIITVEEDSPAGDPELKAADQIVDALGSNYTARMPRGTNLQVVAPGRNAGQVHHEIIEESDKQNSKLVLGQTGTTDAVPAGLNSSQANVMQDEQLGVLIHDAGELSEVVESFVTDRIIAVNFGELEVTHAPTFKLRADLPADRVAELTRLKAAIDAGLGVARSEAYEISGFSIPEPDEVVIRLEQPPTPPNSPVAPAVRPMVVYPVGQSPDVGEAQPAARAAGPEAASASGGADAGAANAATTVTVNEDREARGLPPLTLPGGAADPRGDMTIEEFQRTFEAPEGTEPEPTPEPTAEPEPAKQAMTGPQIAAAVDIVERYRTGKLPRESAHEMLVAIFPFTSQQADRILGEPPDEATLPTAATPPTPPPTPPPANGNATPPEEDNEDEDEDEDEDELEAADPGFGLKRVRGQGVQLSDNMAHEIAEGDHLYGEAGIHAHVVLRQVETTESDGAHSHIFKLPNGMFVVTQMDGEHTHQLGSVDAEDTQRDGQHMHALIMGGVVQYTGSEISAHSHELQANATAVDGAHRHTLKVPDPDNPGETITLNSMTASELAAEMRAGTLPMLIEEMIPEDGEEEEPDAQAGNRRKVYGDPALYDRLLSALGDAGFARQLATTCEQHAQEIGEWNDWVAAGGQHVALELEQDQQRTKNGSPEDYVVRGMRELTRETAAWTTALENAVEGETSAITIFSKLQRAALALPVDRFGRALERRKVQCLMLGVLDNVLEVSGQDPDAGAETIEEATDAEVGQVLDQLITASKVMLQTGEDEFTKRPYQKAIAYFRSLNVLDRASFERAQAAIKQRSFTVAGVLRDQMLRTLQDELAKSIESGEDLRKFKARIKPRLQQAGFLGEVGKLKDGRQALNASHIETVFRTNALNTYNTGRYVHQSSPSVMSAFPVWEFRAVRDTRSRTTHMAVHGKRLLANDPFWASAYPPFGYNCRCRVVSRGRKYLSEIISGSAILGLPDPGFTSGRPALALG